jgi:hypothetical protein
MKEIKPKNKKNEPKSIKELLLDWQFSPDREKSQRYVKHEFQDYGIRLAYKLNDLGHKTLYLRLAKTIKRELLEEAERFVSDYYGMEGKNKGRLFMWALGRLKRGEKLNYPTKNKKYQELNSKFQSTNSK